MAIDRVPDRYIKSIHDAIEKIKDTLPKSKKSKRLHEILDYMNRKSVIINPKLYSTDIITLKETAKTYRKKSLLKDVIESLESLVDEQLENMLLDDEDFTKKMEKEGIIVQHIKTPKQNRR